MVEPWVGSIFGVASCLCDVLDEKPSLRGVPLPLPLKELSYNDGMGMKLGSPGQRRGIAFIREESCLKFVHLEVRDVRLRAKADKTGAPYFRTDNWVVTTWTKSKMTNTFDDWHPDSEVEASDITIDDPAVSQALDSVLLRRPQGNGDAVEKLALNNLSMSQPTVSVSSNHVFLAARQKYMDPQAWILAVDVKNHKLEAVVNLGDQCHYGAAVLYFPSRIPRHLNPMEFFDRATTPEPVSFHMESLKQRFGLHSENLILL